MITQSKYEQIDHETIKVVSALSHSAIKTLLEKGTIQLSLFDEKNVVEIIEINFRYPHQLYLPEFQSAAC